MVENALCAALVALELGLPLDAVRAGLRSVRADAASSLGRLNVYRLPSGGRAIVDFAHNAAGMAALRGVADAARPGRVTVIASQSGDRTDALIARYADAVASLAPDLVILKELPHHLRGRSLGEVPGMLRRLLEARGVTALIDVPDEVAAVGVAVDHTGPGDLALLLVHEQLDAALALLAARGAAPEG